MRKLSYLCFGIFGVLTILHQLEVIRINVANFRFSGVQSDIHHFHYSAILFDRLSEESKRFDAGQFLPFRDNEHAIIEEIEKYEDYSFKIYLPDSSTYESVGEIIEACLYVDTFLIEQIDDRLLGKSYQCNIDGHLELQSMVSTMTIREWERGFKYKAYIEVEGLSDYKFVETMVIRTWLQYLKSSLDDYTYADKRYYLQEVRRAQSRPLD